MPSPNARQPVVPAFARHSLLATRHFLSVSSVLIHAFLVSYGCGGGSSQTSAATATPSADFSLSLSSNSVSVMQGSTSGPVSIAVDAEDGFTGSVQVSLAGLPVGVVSNPASPFSVAAGASVSVFFGVTPGAATGNFTVTAQGASGLLSHSATLAITVQSSLGYSAQVYANPAFNGQPSPYKFVLYDQQRQFLYFSAPGSIDVFDLQASTFKPYTLALYCPSFKSPGPCPDDDVRGLALTPDGSQLFAADFGSQNIYLLNPDTPAIPAEAVPVAASGYNPARLAATKAQSLFVAFSGAATSSGMCTACLSEINLSASPPALQQPPQSVLSGLAASPVVEGDALGDRVFFSYATSPGGPFGFWDAALGTFTLSSANETTNDLAAAADGTRLSPFLAASSKSTRPIRISPR